MARKHLVTLAQCIARETSHKRTRQHPRHTGRTISDHSQPLYRRQHSAGVYCFKHWAMRHKAIKTTGHTPKRDGVAQCLHHSNHTTFFQWQLRHSVTHSMQCTTLLCSHCKGMSEAAADGSVCAPAYYVILIIVSGIASICASKRQALPSLLGQTG